MLFHLKVFLITMRLRWRAYRRGNLDSQLFGTHFERRGYLARSTKHPVPKKFSTKK